MSQPTVEDANERFRANCGRNVAVDRLLAGPHLSQDNSLVGSIILSAGIFRDIAARNAADQSAHPADPQAFRIQAGHAPVLKNELDPQDSKQFRRRAGDRPAVGAEIVGVQQRENSFVRLHRAGMIPARYFDDLLICFAESLEARHQSLQRD